jgi:hypothetical protein
MRQYDVVLRLWTGITLALIVVAIFFMAAKPFA